MISALSSRLEKVIVIEDRYVCVEMSVTIAGLPLLNAK